MNEFNELRKLMEHLDLMQRNRQDAVEKRIVGWLSGIHDMVKAQRNEAKAQKEQEHLEQTIRRILKEVLDEQ